MLEYHRYRLPTLCFGEPRGKTADDNHPMNIRELFHARKLHLKKIILRIPHVRVTYQNGITEHRSY